MRPITEETTIPDYIGLAELGWSAFIMPRGSKIPAAGFTWERFQTRKPTPTEVANWQGSRANVAIVTGKLSDLLVIDVDAEEAQRFVDSFDLPPTPIAKSSRGRHYYFRHPAKEVRSKINIRGIHLDVKGEGGYVIGPGSQHPDGTIYRWEVSPNDCPPADLPTAVLDQLCPEKTTTSLVAQGDGGEFVEAGVFSVWVNREVQEAISQLRDAQEGERNDTLFRVAAKLANHAAAIGLDWAIFADSLRPEATATGLTPEEVDGTLQSAWKAGSATPTAWLQIARNWVFVASRDRFWSPRTGQELSTKAFSMNFAEAMPYEKGTLANFLTKAGLIERVLDFRFEPRKPQGIIKVAGEPFYNTYQAPGIEPAEGDFSPLEDFLSYLVPAEEERSHLLKMMAWTIANPGEKLSYALLLQSRKHGVGKSTLVEIWRELLGKQNTRKTNSEEMDSAYQSYLADTLLVVLEELNLGTGISVYNRLKDMITGTTAIVNEKYVKQREVPNLANFVFLSNLEAPILIEQGDRRFFVIDTPAEPRPSEYWAEFQSWWRSNLGVVKNFFDRVDLTGFEPMAAPPMTQAKERLKKQSINPLTQALQELIEERPWPICRGICTAAEIRVALRRAGFRTEDPRKIASALKDLGCAPLKQVRLSDQSRATFWALFDVERWQDAPPSEVREFYEDPSALGSLGQVAA